MDNNELEARLSRVEDKLERLLGLLEGGAAARSPATHGGNGNGNGGATVPFGGLAGRARVAQGDLLQEAAVAVREQMVAVHGADAVRARYAEAIFALSHPEVLDSVTRIIELAPRIEYAVQAAAAGPELLEDALAAARDLARSRGEDPRAFQERIEAVGELAMQLSARGPREALGRIGLASPDLLPWVEGAAQASRALASEEGAEAMTARIAETVLRIAEPEALESLAMLAELAPRLEYAAQAVAAAPALLEDAMHSVQASLAARDEVVDMGPRVERAAEALLTLTRPDTLDTVQTLAERLPHLGGLATAAASATEAREALEGPDAFRHRIEEAVLELTDPETLDALVRIAQLAPRLELAVQAAAAAPDVFEDFQASVKAEIGHDHVRVRAALDLVKRLTEPRVIDGLANLADLVPVLGSARHTAVLAKLAEQVPEIVEGLGEIDLDSLHLGGLGPILEVVGRPDIQEAVRRLLGQLPRLVPVIESLPIQPRTLAVLRSVNEAVEASAEDVDRVGAWGAFRKLSSPDVQRALGFTVAVAEQLGGHLADPPPRLPKGE